MVKKLKETHKTQIKYFAFHHQIEFFCLLYYGDDYISKSELQMEIYNSLLGQTQHCAPKLDREYRVSLVSSDFENY